MALVVSVRTTQFASDLRSAAPIAVERDQGRTTPARSTGTKGEAALAVEDCSVNASVISAFAALAGTAVGGLTSVIANWLTHRIQVRAQWLQHEKNLRQTLYRDFIEEASKCYIDALQHDQADIAGLVGLYAKLGRMRVLSSRPVVHSAESIVRKILDTYLEPDKTFVELRDMAIQGTIDLWHDFARACREEFEDLQARQL
jgi:hypothetical protein